MTLQPLSSLLRSKASYKFLTCVFLVLTADHLFYDAPIGEQETGWTLGIFGLLLFLASALHNKPVAGGPYYNAIFFITAGTCFSLMENRSLLAIGICGISVTGFALLAKLPQLNDARQLFKKILGYVFTGLWRLNRDAIVLAYIRKRRQQMKVNKAALFTYLALPFGFTGVFVCLFAQANPVLAGWLNAMDIISWFFGPKFFDLLERIVFWIGVAFASWAIVRPKVLHRNSKVSVSQNKFTLLNLLFNESSILLSLIMFNILFCAQNAMDILFIWSGAALPQGLTHAQYAHAGAYPLVVTALLAAWFVLVAFKPGSVMEGKTTVHALMYAWVGQNIFLVCSSIMRLLGYVGEYSLTYLRVAAFIWMGLVALGLILIVVRIHLRKSSLWLVNTNFIALYATLYLCCFISFGNMIAMYNVTHCYEVTGHGEGIDMLYLKEEIGVEALPAIIWFDQHVPANRNNTRDAIRELQDRLDIINRNWRLWTFRNLRLALNFSREGK